LTFLNIHIYFIILKTFDQQFTLTTKKSLHIIFKPHWGPAWPRHSALPWWQLNGQSSTIEFFCGTSKVHSGLYVYTRDRRPVTSGHLSSAWVCHLFRILGEPQNVWAIVSTPSCTGLVVISEQCTVCVCVSVCMCTVLCVVGWWCGTLKSFYPCQSSEVTSSLSHSSTGHLCCLCA